MSILASALLLLGAEGAAQTNLAALSEPDPKSMSQKEIREFNAKVTRRHPFYIRCVKSDETGSLVKKLFSCRTNQQWEIAFANGNESARATVDAMSSKLWITG